MKVQVQAFQVPKNGSSAEECQDALDKDEKNGIYAIADGVSDSAFQRLWARLLVTSFVANARSQENFTPAWLASWLETEQSEWQSQVNWDAIPWHGRLKAQQTGGEATFLGLRFFPERAAWTGFAIGDCNLFQFNRDHACLKSIPIPRSVDFSNATQAFSSIRKDLDQVIRQVKFLHGTYADGDYLVLATDALARWILERLEEQRDPLQELLAAHEPVLFNQWVNAQRQGGRLKDDDTSILLIRVEPVKALRDIPTEAPKPPARIPQFAILLAIALWVVFTVGGFWLGAAWQSGNIARRLENEVQKPLLNWINAIVPSSPPAANEIKKKILEIIVTVQPGTGTGLNAADCRQRPTQTTCNPGP